MLKIQPKKLSLKEAFKGHPELRLEVEQLVAKTEFEERQNVLAEVGLSEKGLANQDPHYGLYRSLSTPSQVVVESGFINGWKKGENSKDVPLQEFSPELQRVYEGIAGGDDLSSLGASVAVASPFKKRQSEAEFRLVQLITNSRYNVDPHMRNIIDNMKRYIIGNGFKITSEDEAVDEVIDDFVDQTDLQEILKDYVLTSFKDGEVGLNVLHRYRPSVVQKAYVEWAVHKVFSEEVRGFETHPLNSGIKYSYFRQVAIYDAIQVTNLGNTWIADIEYFYALNSRGNVSTFDRQKSQKELKDTSVMLWYQHGDKRELRGRVPVEPVLRDCRLYEDFRINRAILNYERSKVLYIKKTRPALNRKAPVTDLRRSISPKGGVQLTLQKDEDYEMVTADLAAQDADHDGLMFLYAISAGTSIPIYILGMRADVQNYGAIKNTDSPFHQMIFGYAESFSANFRKLLKWVVFINAKYGVLPEKTKIQRVAKEKQDQWFNTMKEMYVLVNEAQQALAKKKKQPVDSTAMTPQQGPTMADLARLDAALQASMEEVTIDTVDVPITITMSESIKPNPLELAKTAFIERKLGMVSSQTLSEMRGYNWPKELRQMLEEMILGVYSPSSGQAGSATSGVSDAGGGLGSGDTVQSGDGVTNQNANT